MKVLLSCSSYFLILFYQPTLLVPARLSKNDVTEKMPKELANFVNHYVGTLDNKHVFFDKTIILKEVEAKNLESRLNEILKFENEKRVIFGIFSPTVKPKIICKIFKDKAKLWIKKGRNGEAARGHIWTVEVNGRCKGCGVIAADDKIRVWRDRW